MKRKKFIGHLAGLGGAAILAPNLVSGKTGNPVYNAAEIDEFVLAAHNNLDKTRKLIDKNPLLLNCASQVVKGDFETAIGGASHMGRMDIAQLLFDKGARLDIFNLVFLGYTEVVKSLIEIQPDYLRAYGPHGFTLLHHAKVGKQDKFSDWLRKQGLEEEIFKNMFG